MSNCIHVTYTQLRHSHYTYHICIRLTKRRSVRKSSGPVSFEHFERARRRATKGTSLIAQDAALIVVHRQRGIGGGEFFNSVGAEFPESRIEERSARASSGREIGDRRELRGTTQNCFLEGERKCRCSRRKMLTWFAYQSFIALVWLRLAEKFSRNVPSSRCV